MSEGPGSRWLAWTLGSASVGLSISGLVLLLLTLDAPVGEVYGMRGATMVLAIPMAVVGTVLATRRPHNPIGWLFSLGGLAMGMTMFGEQYATYSYVRADSSLPLTDPIAWLQSWLWVPAVAFVLVYPLLLFPDGRLPSRRWRWLAWVAPPVILAFGLAISFAPGQLQSVAEGFVNPFAIDLQTSEMLLSVLGIPFISVVALSVFAMARRFRRSTGDEHAQMKWLLFAGIVAAVAMAMNLVAGVGGIGGAVWQVVAILTQISIVGIAVAMGVAVLRYRLYEIEVVINRTVVFTILAAFLATAYVGIIVGIGALVGSWGGSNVVLPIAATAIVGVAFQPVWQRANRFANRLVYGRRRSPYEALTALAAGQSLEDLLPQIARMATESTTARRSFVWVSTGTSLDPAAAWPEDGSMPEPVPFGEGGAPSFPDDTHAWSLLHQGELLGAITARVGPGETLSQEDNRLLSDLAAHAAIAVRGVLEAVELPEGIVTFLMTDVEGSTRVWEEDPQAMAGALREHDALIRRLVREHGGILMKWRGEGDSTFSVFTDAAGALSAAGEIQGAMANHAWPTPRPLAIRAALHTGAAELRGRDYFGPAVNRCARLRALARGGQTLVSAAARELVRDGLPRGLDLVDLGERELKDLGPERVYELRAAGVAPHDPGPSERPG